MPANACAEGDSRARFQKENDSCSMQRSQEFEVSEHCLGEKEGHRAPKNTRTQADVCGRCVYGSNQPLVPYRCAVKGFDGPINLLLAPINLHKPPVALGKYGYSVEIKVKGPGATLKQDLNHHVGIGFRM